MRPRFDNKVFLIDTGMLSSYYPGGRASALEICDEDKFIAQYIDQETPLGATASQQNRRAAATAAGTVVKSAGSPPVSEVRIVCGAGSANLP
jgi:hypothetical protein